MGVWTWVLTLTGVGLALMNGVMLMSAYPSIWMALLAVLAGICFGFTGAMTGFAIDGDLFGAWWRYTRHLKRQQNRPEN